MANAARARWSALSWLVVALPAIVVWGWFPVGTARAGTFAPFVPRFSLFAQPLASTFQVAGAYVLITSEGAPPVNETVISQQTGASHTWSVSSRCRPVLTPNRLVNKCGTRVTARRLPDGAETPLGVHYAALGPAGTYWERLGSSSFINLQTGHVVVDRDRRPGRVYPDLNSPRLFHDACAPINVPPLVVPGAYLPLSPISFFGHTAVTPVHEPSKASRDLHPRAEVRLIESVADLHRTEPR